jgi:hypothetical protein
LLHDTQVTDKALGPLVKILLQRVPAFWVHFHTLGNVV